MTNRNKPDLQKLFPYLGRAPRGLGVTNDRATDTRLAALRARNLATAAMTMMHAPGLEEQLRNSGLFEVLMELAAETQNVYKLCTVKE